ncbi:MAG: hypothetical protein H8E72_09755 [Candidatus Marinimicrobia bacterium]|nr:hypothetical protein [Candidatus Neomarinimicrobiota bacterium]
MRNQTKYILTITILIASMFAGEFQLKLAQRGQKTLTFTQQEIEIATKDGFTRLTTPEKGSTVDEGMPELPVFTSFFQMESGISYDVNYSAVSSHVVEDVEIYPYQGEPVIGVERPFLKNVNFYNTNTNYPETKLTVSEPMIMRDIEVGLISLTPYEYNSATKSLTVYDEVEISIVEAGVRDVNTNFPTQRSKLFEPFYEDLIVDYEPLNSRDEYQPSAIMYICGGASASHPYVQQLVEWREKQGYIVYLIPTSQTGSSSSSIKSFLQDVMSDYENPPEIVGLIGDTNGSYSIPNFTYSGGSTDVEYSYLSGNDFLPEVFIGRISVSSSSDLSNVINKTLTYEKAENQIDAWYERAALVGDPTSSGVSTITTMKYIANIMENHGMDDMRTNYGSGNYNNWVDNQFSDGILYYNYRGYIGSSSISPSGTNSGIYAPFVGSLTCATGDFGGTSESESWIRQGSLSNPQGAVAAVGVATSSTHTAYNNIVHMGMYEGIFSKSMYHAGASLANGKLALLRTYPTNPNSAVSKFSSWPNLMGDPALHLWTGQPHDFTIDSPASLPSGVQNMEVTITDENGDAVEDARVTLILAGQHYSAYTDQSGDAIVTWTSASSGDAVITAFKNDFRLAEVSIQIGQVAGVAIYLDQTRAVIDDSIYGDGNLQINPGEVFEITLPLLNFGSENAHSLNVELVSENVYVTIENSSQFIDVISSNQNRDLVFSVSVDDNLHEGETLGLRLLVSNENESWNLPVPTYVYGPKLELSGYEVLDASTLEPGEESAIDLLFHNSGSRDIEGLVIELDDSNDFIQIIENNTTSISIPAGGQVIVSAMQIRPVSHMINGSTVSLGYSFVTDAGYEGSDYITMSVGTRDEGDPMGPDEHGYYIYDSGDVSYPLAPEYDWIEITGGAGGGQSLNLTDAGNGCFTGGSWGCGSNLNGQDSEVVQLPFPFQFYGIEYDEITVSTNGWIAFGDREMSAFRNYSVPGAGGPSPMVAAFWDDLTTDNGGQVYKLLTDNYVIIQWNNMRIYEHGGTNDVNSFQIILYNEGFTGNIPETGDGEIKIQFKKYRNISDGDYYEYTPLHGDYSTTGIENHLGSVGLEYSFNNQNPTEAMPLSDQTAIFITTSLGYTYTLGDVNQDDELNVLDVVTTVNFILGVLEPTAYQQYAGDMNDDDSINILDVVLLVNIILNN